MIKVSRCESSPRSGRGPCWKDVIAVAWTRGIIFDHVESDIDYYLASKSSK